MANPTTLPGDLVVPGNVRITGSISPAMAMADILTVVANQPFNVPWNAWRKWDDIDAVLPDTPATDDLGLMTGTFATDHPSIQTVDFGGTNTTAYARAQIALPWNYVAAQTVTLRFHAGCITTLPDTTATLDCAVYKCDKDLTLSADLAPAADANNIKSLTFADVDFALTSTALSPGDVLDVRVSINGVDAGDLGVMRAVIGQVDLLCGVR